MPTVTLSESCDAKLKTLVTEPFEQTRESIVEDLIDAEVKRRGMSPNGNGSLQTTEGVLQLNPDSHESLSHTRLLSASVNGRAIHRPKWNGIREDMHLLALKRLGSYDALHEATSANLRQGKYEENGYKYLPEGDLSIQGVGADLAWDHCLQVARTLGIAIKVTFEWRDKEGAAHPGQRGALEWDGDEQGMARKGG